MSDNKLKEIVSKNLQSIECKDCLIQGKECSNLPCYTWVVSNQELYEDMIKELREYYIRK